MAGRAAIARENGKKGGRPVGSKTRPKISDFLTEKDVQELVKLAKSRAKNSDRVLTFLLEQALGKAPQAMDITSQGEKLQLVLPHEILGKYAHS